MEAKFPRIEEAHVQVKVGVATGADDVFIVKDYSLVEQDRLMPTIAARDLVDGQIYWRGTYLINPWDSTGLANLKDYPLLARYFNTHKKRLNDRHVAKRQREKWWRTIDRINPKIETSEKLLIPDVRSRIDPFFDDGRFYPMHNLYYLLSDEWDLKVLGGLLLSDVANLFVEAYSVRMANGYLRVSAQYLRRVRIPEFSEIPKCTKRALKVAFNSRDIGLANSAALEAYGLKTLPK